MATPKVTEGTIPFIVDGESFSTWYTLVGDLSTSTRPPLVVLHGGPGTSHDYMLPLTDLAARSTPTPVILYDQIGTARSTHLPSKPAAFWTVELFVAELENVLTHFGIADSFDLHGHSWGAMLAAEYIVRRQPKGLRRLVLSNCPASASLRNNARAKLVLTLPEDVQHTITSHEKDGSTSAPEYRMAMRVFYGTFACKLNPMPDKVIYSLSQSEDSTGGHNVYTAMRTNILEHAWDITDRIHLIRVPTLLINGEYDYMTDEVCAPYFHGIDKVKWVKFALSSHMPHWEERERYIDVVGGFLG